MRVTLLIVLSIVALHAARVHGQPPASAGTAQTQTQRTPAAADASPPAAGRLPVKRVVLYKSGIGYFEHVGRISGSQAVAIDLTSGQLDDVLKSLTTVDLGGGRVTGITFNSTAPLEQRLRTLRLPLGEHATRAELFRALRGVRVEAGAVTGRVLQLGERARKIGDVMEPIEELTLVSDAGEVRSVLLTPGVSVRVADPELRRELGQYLDLIGSARAQDVRRLSVATQGSGTRDLFVSYVSEVPVWKTTYRLVIPPEANRKPFLQGWAIVDNTLGEDWTGVELSLVAGAPQSFVQPLSQPLYTRRPVVPLAAGALFAPQTHGGTLTSGTGTLRGRVVDANGAALPGTNVRLLVGERMVASAVTEASGSFTLNGAPGGNLTVEASMPGFTTTRQTVVVQPGGTTDSLLRLEVGSPSETVMVQAAPAFQTGRTPSRSRGAGGGVPGGVVGGMVGGVPNAPPPPAEAAMAVMRAQTPAARGAELGELFEYRLSQPVTIRRNQSALVPIVEADVTAERVSLWNAAVAGGRPLRAVWLTNETGATLDGGSLTLVEANAFAGEGLVDPIKPGERRLVSYAADLGMRVTSATDGGPQRVSRLRIAGGLFTQEIEERASTRYTVRNEEAGERVVVLEHPIRDGWRLAGTSRPAESSAAVHRFRLTVAAKSTGTLAVDEVHPTQTTIAVTELTDDQIALILRARTIDPALEPKLKEVAARTREIERLGSEIDSRASEVERITADQERVRENLKALKGSDAERALTERYARQLGTQEDRLDLLRRDIEKLSADRDARGAALHSLIATLTLDAVL